MGERIGGRFARSEPRRRAVGYVRGLLSEAERKNGWQLAEHLGDPTPDGVQHLLARADWDADAVRDDLLAYVAEHLGDPDGVLVVDETGFLKKGEQSVGVARQYSGTAGRIENCQVGVFLGYATTKGRALLDRALYLPKEWAADKTRRKRAGVPKAVAFATKLVLARRMIDRAVAAGVPARWVTADAVYGSDYHFRAAVEGHGLGYVVGVRTDFAVRAGPRQVRAKALLAEVPADGWHRLSCGAGSKGPRRLRLGAAADGRPRAGCVYPLAADPAERVGPGGRGVLRVRRPARDDVERLGPRRRDALGDRGPVRAGQGRLRAGRVRGAGLGRVAPARHPEPVGTGGRGRDPVPRRRAGGKGGAKVIPLTVPEVRNLLLRLVWAPAREDEEVLAWSDWRRTHQYRARAAHYKRRKAKPPDG